MASIIAIVLGIGFSLSAVFLLATNRSRRRIILSRFNLRGRSLSHSKTPPRCLTPSTPEQMVKEKAALSPDYSAVFPPSRREALLEVYDSTPKDHPIRQLPRKVIAQRAGPETGEAVPLNTHSPDLNGREFTPTGLSIEEIRLLGEFPDYATLSGIPLPAPFENFAIEKALPRPYRPFRWAYHQTMSLTKMECDWWLELTKDYKSVIALRLDLFVKHGPLVLQYLPGSEIASKELMEMALQFLVARYPECFTLHPPEHASLPLASKPRCWVFENKILNTVTNLDGSEHPLVTILNHVPEDFAIMLRNPETGIYHFRAGVICSSLGWSLGSKMGLKLHEIHAPVPDYAEKMQFSMDRYFAKKPTERAIQRGSWGLEVDTPLFMPPGDPHEAYRDYQMDPSELPLSRIKLRVDWQTLRRLPLSGAVVFNFKGLFTPIEEFRDEPFIPKLVLKILNEGKENIMKYKNCWHVEHVAKPALEAWTKEQEEQGIVEQDWEERTLDDSPYFRGWEKKWQRQMAL